MKLPKSIRDFLSVRVRSAQGIHDSAGLSVRSNGVWSLFGNGVFAGCQMGMLIVMARLGSKELVGTYALGLAITSPVFLFFALQLRTLLAADAADDIDLNVYFAVRLMTTIAATMVAAGLGWLLMMPGTASVAVAIAVSKAIDSFHDLAYGIHWRSNRMDFIARSMLARGVLGLAAFAVAFAATGSLAAAVVALCIVWLVVLIAYDGPMVQELSLEGSPRWWLPAWSASTVKRLVWLGLPAGVLSWLVSLQMYVPRYVVQHRLGEADLGVFSALASVFVGVELAARSFNHAAVPRLARYAAAKQADALGQLVRQLTGLGLLSATLLIAGSVLFGRPLISLLFGESYAEQSTVFVILTFGFAVRSATMPTAMTLRAVNAYWHLVAVQLLTVVVLFAGCLVLVPRFGLEGCAMACVAGFACDGMGRIVLHYQLVSQPIAVTCAAGELARAA